MATRKNNVGTKKTNVPRLTSDILREANIMNDLPFPMDEVEEVMTNPTWGLFHNTELCVDVKTNLLFDRVMKTGKRYYGFFTKDGEDHITLVEKEKKSVSNYDKPYDGELISFTQRDDMTFRSHFKDFAIPPTLTEKEVRKLGNKLKCEFVNALLGLVEKKEVAH